MGMNVVSGGGNEICVDVCVVCETVNDVVVCAADDEHEHCAMFEHECDDDNDDDGLQVHWQGTADVDDLTT